MKPKRAFTMLCLASYEKGQRFLEEAKQQGCRVLLLTSQSLQGKWPQGIYDEIFYMPDKEFEWNLLHMVQGVNHLCRTEKIERIVPLDDFDLEKAALLAGAFAFAGVWRNRDPVFSRQAGDADAGGRKRHSRAAVHQHVSLSRHHGFSR